MATIKASFADPEGQLYKDCKKAWEHNLRTGTDMIARPLPAPTPGKCSNPRCLCTGECMRGQVEEYWGSEAAKQWSLGLK